jgi:hypothetical protein
MVAPQCPTTGSWNDSTRRAQVLALMQALQKQYNIDEARLYITGLSMGGIGTWDYIAQYTNMYAAAIPMSGSGSVDLASRMTGIPIWNFHGANDATVSVTGSRSMVGAVRRAGGNAIYTEYASGGHGIWTPAYATPILMNWVYAQRRGVAATNAPLLRITQPTGEPIFASTNISSLNLAGTANDGTGTVNLVTWTNYQGQIAIGNTASGTQNWIASGIPLDSASTNLILVTGRGASYYPVWGGNTTFNDTLRVIFPPVIVRQLPVTRTVNQGTTAGFEIGLASNRAATTYQWVFNGTNLPGKTASTLVLQNVQYTNSGIYAIRVSNIFGTIISSNSVLIVNRAPVPNSQTLTVLEDNSSPITLTGSDPDGDALTYLVDSPSHGTLSGVAPNLIYLGAANYNGPDSFTFRVNDGLMNSAAATVNITVLPINDPPEVQPQSLTIDEDTATAITLLASDVDGDALTYQVQPPGHGSLSGTAPNLVYQPVSNYFGTDTIIFRVNDGNLNSPFAAVTIQVRAVNDAPVAVTIVSPLLRLTSSETNLLVLSLNNTNAQVVLDGSTSSDVEGDALEYMWLEQDDGLIATGAISTNVFAVGGHSLDLVVSDGTASATNHFEFEVVTPASAALELSVMLQEADIPNRNKNPLLASLRAAMAAFDRGNFGAADNQLRAFQQKVRVQLAPIDPELASELLAAAQALLDQLTSFDPRGLLSGEAG